MESGRNSQFYRALESAEATARPASESPTLAPGMTAIRYVPPRSANPTSDVVVPTLQSLIAALSISTAVLAVLVGVPWFDELQQEAWTITLVICAVAFAAVYIVLMRRHSDATTLVQVIEEVTRLDLNQDGAVGKPEPPVERIVEPLVIHTQPETRKYHIPNFGDVPYDALHTFLDYADEDGLTLDSARTAGLDRRQWNAAIAYLVNLQLAEPKEQGEDAHLLVEHDALMRRVFAGQ